MDLEKNGQSAQPILGVDHQQLARKLRHLLRCVLQRPKMMCKRPLRILSKCAHIMQSITPITYPDTKYVIFTISSNSVYVVLAWQMSGGSWQISGGTSDSRLVIIWQGAPDKWQPSGGDSGVPTVADIYHTADFHSIRGWPLINHVISCWPNLVRCKFTFYFFHGPYQHYQPPGKNSTPLFWWARRDGCVVKAWD